MILNKPIKIIHLKAFVWLYLLILSCTFSSCDKDPLEECRKDPTCEYFVCKVNGERWEPQCNIEPLFGCTPWIVQYNKSIPGFFASIKNEKDNQHIYLTVRESKLKIGYNKLFINEFIKTRFTKGTNEVCNIYALDTLQPYSLSFSKIDTINFLLKGEFYFVGKNECNENINISEGEFNLNYTY